MRSTGITLEQVVFILMRGLFLLLAAVALSVLVYAIIISGCCLSSPMGCLG